MSTVAFSVVVSLSQSSPSACRTRPRTRPSGELNEHGTTL